MSEYIIHGIALFSMGLNVALWRLIIKNRLQITKGQIPPGLAIGAWYGLLRRWFGIDDNGPRMLTNGDAWDLAFYLSILQGLGGSYWFPLYHNPNELAAIRDFAWQTHKAIHASWNAIASVAAIKWRYPITDETRLAWTTVAAKLPDDVVMHEHRTPGVQGQTLPAIHMCGYSEGYDIFYAAKPPGNSEQEG